MHWRRLAHGALLAATAAAAFAQPAEDYALCRKTAGNPDVAIRHCTRAIESGELAPPELARALTSRGAEKAAKRDYPGALADFDAALKAEPGLVEAHYGRGIAWANRGEADRAIADFDVVLNALPKNAEALQARGTEYLVKGEYRRALADFDAARDIDPQDHGVHFLRGRALLYAGDHAAAAAALAKAHETQPGYYTAFWLFLARSHGGIADAVQLLDRDTKSTRDNRWPRGVLSLYLGMSDPQRLVKLASAGDPATRAEQRCEALFYAAHWHLLHKAPQAAKPLLDDAQKTCPKNALEYEGALAALRSLKP